MSPEADQTTSGLTGEQQGFLNLANGTAAATVAATGTPPGQTQATATPQVDRAAVTVRYRLLVGRAKLLIADPKLLPSQKGLLGDRIAAYQKSSWAEAASKLDDLESALTPTEAEFARQTREAEAEARIGKRVEKAGEDLGAISPDASEADRQEIEAKAREIETLRGEGRWVDFEAKQIGPIETLVADVGRRIDEGKVWKDRFDRADGRRLSFETVYKANAGKLDEAKKKEIAGPYKEATSLHKTIKDLQARNSMGEAGPAVIGFEKKVHAMEVAFARAKAEALQGEIHGIEGAIKVEKGQMSLYDAMSYKSPQEEKLTALRERLKAEGGDADKLEAVEGKRLDALYPNRAKSLQALDAFRGRVDAIRGNIDASAGPRSRLEQALLDGGKRADAYEFDAAAETVGKAGSELESEEKRLEQLAIDRKKFRDAQEKFNQRFNPVLNDPDAPLVAVNKLQEDRDAIAEEADRSGGYIDAIDKLKELDKNLADAEIEVRARSMVRANEDRYYVVKDEMYYDDKNGAEALGEEWDAFTGAVGGGKWSEAIKAGNQALKRIKTFEEKRDKQGKALALKNAIQAKESATAKAAGEKTQKEHEAALKYGDEQFKGGLLRDIWAAAKAARTSSPANGSIGDHEYDVDAVTGLYAGWQVANSGILTNFHIPGKGPKLPQCKWEKDFSRPHIEANFCCFWRTKMINIHVRVAPKSFFDKYEDRVDWSKVPSDIAKKYRK